MKVNKTRLVVYSVEKGGTMLYKVVGESLSDKVMFEQRFKRKGASIWISGKRTFQAERLASLKALRLT